MFITKYKDKIFTTLKSTTLNGVLLELPVQEDPGCMFLQMQLLMTFRLLKRLTTMMWAQAAHVQLSEFLQSIGSSLPVCPELKK